MTSGLAGLIPYLIGFVQAVIVFILALAVLTFVWGIFKLVVASGDSKEREQARGYIFWGVVALAVMVSVWGLVNLLTSSFGLGNTGPTMPDFPLLH
ncbi:MAG: hypothetical protein WCO09_04080 [bacterium]